MSSKITVFIDFKSELLNTGIVFMPAVLISDFRQWLDSKYQFTVVGACPDMPFLKMLELNRPKQLKVLSYTICKDGKTVATTGGLPDAIAFKDITSADAIYALLEDGTIKKVYDC